MKALIAASAMALLAGCTSATEFGKCIGITETGKPDLVYKASTKNVILGIVFIETIVAPVIVVLDEFNCPVGKK
jgi:hypothetical protein